MRGQDEADPARPSRRRRRILDVASRRSCRRRTPPHDRTMDQYGFVAFDANNYWMPSGGDGDVKVLEYSQRDQDLRRPARGRPLPAATRRREEQGLSRGPAARAVPTSAPGNPTGAEEAAMRTTAPEIGAYLDFALKGHGLSRHRQIRSLYGLFRRLSRPLFCRVVERAHHFRVTDIETLGEIARHLLEGYGRDHARRGRRRELRDARELSGGPAHGASGPGTIRPTIFGGQR